VVGDATVAGHVLALSPSGIFAPNAGQGPLWRTTDSGLSWTRGRGINAAHVSDIAASPKVPGLVLAATDADAMQRSTDGGMTWSSARTGLPSAQVFAVAFDTKTPSIAFATTNADGTFRSTDSGKTWTKLGGGAPNLATLLQSDRLKPGRVYAGYSSQMYISKDSGGTWNPLPTAGLGSFFYVRSIIPDPAAPGAIYATGDYGIYHLADGASSWTPSMNGLGDTTGIADIAVDPTSKQRWLAATEGGGVYRSTDGGHTWHPATNGIPESFLNDVVFDPLVPNRAYVSAEGGVYRTNDGGATWAPLTGGLAVPSVFKLLFDADAHTLYGSTHNIGVIERTRGVAPGGKAKVHGKAKVGSNLSLTITTTGFPVPKVSISWQRCSASGSSCKSIHGAKGKKYKPKSGDRGHRLRAVVTLSNAVGKTSIRTKLTGAVK
jgi:photosystem II stability/assembly factor-like uncharacterized protein